MSRLLFTKYWMLAHLFVSASILCFFSVSAIGVALWATTSLLMVMFALPPVYRGESFWGARERVKSAFCKDLLFWTGLPAVFFLFIQLFNSRSTERFCTIETIVKKLSDIKCKDGSIIEGATTTITNTIWSYAPAKTAWLPSSFDDPLVGSFFVAFLVGLVCAIVIRCALPRKQRLSLLIGLSLLSGLYGCLYSLFGDTFLPAMVDTDRSLLFILMLCVSLGIVMEHFLEHRLEPFFFGLAGAVLNAYSLLSIGSPILATVGGGILIIYLFFAVSMAMGTGRGKRFVWSVILILPILLGGGLGLAIGKNTGPWSVLMNDVNRKEYYTNYQNHWSLFTDIEVSIAKDHLFVGSGPTALKRLAPDYIDGGEKEKWKMWENALTADETNPPLYSDIFSLFMEHGLLGMFFILLPFLALFVHAAMILIEYFQNKHAHYSLRYIFIAISIMVGLVVVFGSMIFATPLHSPLLLCLLFMVFSTLTGWLPKRKD